MVSNTVIAWRSSKQAQSSPKDPKGQEKQGHRQRAACCCCCWPPALSDARPASSLHRLLKGHSREGPHAPADIDGAAEDSSPDEAEAGFCSGSDSGCIPGQRGCAASWPVRNPRGVSQEKTVELRCTSRRKDR